MIDKLYNWWSDNLHVRVFASGTATLGDWWRFHYSRVGHWRFYFNQDEGASLDLATGRFPLRSERLYIVPAGIPGLSTYCSPEKEVEHFYVHFDVMGLPDVAMRSLFSSPICLPEDIALKGMVRDTVQDIKKRKTDFIIQWRIKAILYEGLALYLKTLPAEEAELCQQAVLAVAPVLAALHYIQDHYASPVSNASLARLCSMSEDYFIRRFRECVGQSPGQYTLQFRLRMAAQRLLFTQAGIEQIALETGFCHRSHLTRAFHNHFGVSPKTYRSNPGG